MKNKFLLLIFLVICLTSIPPYSDLAFAASLNKDKPKITYDRSLPSFRNRSAQATGKNAVQTIVANQPRINGASMGYLPAVEFDGNNDYLNYEGKDLVKKDYTIFIVERRSSNKANNCLFGTSNPASPLLDVGLKICYKTDTVLSFAQGSNEEIIAIEPFSSNRSPVIHTFTQDTLNGKKYYRNGAVTLTSPNNKSQLVSNDNATIGRNDNYYFNGKIAEVVVISRILSDKEIDDINDYLLQKWNVKKTTEGTGCTPSSPGYVNITDGKWSNNGNAGNSNSLVATCINNTVMIGNITPLTCSNGVYNGGSGGSCGISPCNAPSVALPNGVWNYTGPIGNNQQVNGTCNDGYLGTPTITCNNGGYGAISGSCTKSTCDSAPTTTLTNGSWPVSGYPVNTNTTINGVCDGAYIGNPTITCTNGSWGSVTGSCTIAPSSCNSNPSAITNGSWSTGAVATGSQKTGTCNPGYNGSPTATCTNGTFGSVSGSCTVAASSCASTPSALTNGSWPADVVPTGSQKTGTCNPGYGGSPTATCTNGSFGAISGTCTVLPSSCTSTPSAITNGSWPSGVIETGSQITGTCNPGYSGSPTATCTNGTFGSVTGACTPSPCASAPSNPSYGTWNSTTYPLASGSTINGTCASGNGTMSITCTSGTWNPANSNCGCVNANGSKSIANGSWKNGSTTATTSSNGGSLTASCNAGYSMISGTISNLTCSNGTWAGGTGTGVCATTCTNASGFSSIGTWSAQTAAPGASVTASCNYGFYLSGTIPTLTCGGNGWTLSGGTCAAVTCNAKNINVDGWAYSIASTTSGSCKEYTFSGRQRSGSYDVCCANGLNGGSTGFWKGIVSTCSSCAAEMCSGRTVNGYRVVATPVGESTDYIMNNGQITGEYDYCCANGAARGTWRGKTTSRSPGC